MALVTEEYGVDDVWLGALYYLCQKFRGAGDNYTFDLLGTSHTAIQGSVQLAVGRTFPGHDGVCRGLPINIVGHSSTREDWVNGEGSGLLQPHSNRKNPGLSIHQKQ